MTLVHVVVQAGSGPELGSAVADCVHRSLAEVLGAPAPKRFQIITEQRAGLDADGPANRVERAAPFPGIVVLVYLLGRTGDRVKRRLFGRIGERLAAELGASPDALVVGLIDTPRANWSFGYDEATYREMMAYQFP